jgi:hypothetical protein
MEEIGAGTAVALGYAGAEKPLFPHLSPDVAGNDALLFPCLDMRDDFLLQKFPEALTKYPVTFGVGNEIHFTVPPF